MPAKAAPALDAFPVPSAERLYFAGKKPKTTHNHANRSHFQFMNTSLTQASALCSDPSLVSSLPDSSWWLFLFSALQPPSPSSLSAHDLAPYFTGKIKRPFKNLPTTKSILLPVYVPGSRPSISVGLMNSEIPFKDKSYALDPIFSLLCQHFAPAMSDWLFLFFPLLLEHFYQHTNIQ